MRVEALKTLDLDPHARLYTTVFNGQPWNENWSVANASQRLNCYRSTPNFIGVEAHEGEALLGFIIGNFEPYQSGQVYVLKEMCVATQVQRKGVGAQMLGKLHAILQDSKIETVNLVTRKDSDAESFYMKHGYAQAQRVGLYIRHLRD